MFLTERAEQFLCERGLIYQPNTHANDLTEHLGIKFTKIPKKVGVTPRNREVLKLIGCVSPCKLTRESIINDLSDEYSRGSYIPRLELFLQFAQDNTAFVGHHENAHAYLNQVNPNFVILKADANGMVFDDNAPLAEYLMQRSYPERAKTFKCFDEGVAMWCAALTGLRKGGVDAEVASKWHNDMLCGRAVSGSLDCDFGFISSKFDEVKDSIGKKPKRSILAEKAIYTVGYFFVSTAMSELTRVGWSEAEALDLLIKYHPERFDQLKHGCDFVNYLKVTKLYP